jgi:hypothetical protein
VKRAQRRPAAIEQVREYLARIGRSGGIASRRELTKTQAKQMVAIREAKRAALKAGVPLAEINSWKFTVGPAQPRALRPAPQITKWDFPRGAKLFPSPKRGRS